MLLSPFFVVAQVVFGEVFRSFVVPNFLEQ